MRVGIDVGGTTVKIGFIEDYKIIYRLVVETKKDTLFDDIFGAIKSFVKEKDIDISEIGFGLPGHVSGTYIDKLPNIGIYDLDIAPIANKYFPNVNIYTTNDANAAALGELLNDKDDVKSAYMITLGTGVGGGLVINSKVINGFHANCGEIGHIYVDFNHNYQCTCGLKGCLETVASATGIVRLANDYYDQFKTSIDKNNMSAKTILDAAKKNDELGLFILNYVSESLGRAIATIELCVDVERIYIGGGVSDAGDILINKIKEYYKNYSHYAIKDLEITKAKLGNDAGMLGAAYLF